MDGDHKISADRMPPVPQVREAHDAEHERALRRDPTHDQGKLEIGLDESFPSSDPPAVAQPGKGEPAPSSGYDEEAERLRQQDRD